MKFLKKLKNKLNISLQRTANATTELGVGRTEGGAFMAENASVDLSGLRELLDGHLSRVENTWSAGPVADWARDFLRRFRTEQLETVCLLGAEMLAESLADGKRHSTEVTHSDTFVSVSTFPCGLDEARRNYYSVGYLEYLNSALRTARNVNPACHYVHIQFFWDRSNCWVQFTLFPNKDALGFSPLYILPVDLLTTEERRKAGLS